MRPSLLSPCTAQGAQSSVEDAASAGIIDLHLQQLMDHNTASLDALAQAWCHGMKWLLLGGVHLAGQDAFVFDTSAVYPLIPLLAGIQADDPTLPCLTKASSVSSVWSLKLPAMTLIP